MRQSNRENRVSAKILKTTTGHSLDTVQRVVAEWQEKLWLWDWEIRVQLLDPREMADARGQCDFNAEVRTATISIARDFRDERDLVEIVVHELLHLHFWWTDCDSAKESVQSDLLEFAFNKICPVIAELATPGRKTT